MRVTFPKGDVVGLLLEGIRPGATVVDVGANIGSVAKAAIRAGAERVIAIEPDARSFDRLDAIGSPVQVIKAACGDHTGDVPFYQHAESTQSSLYRDAVRRLDATVTVPMVRLDDVVDVADAIKIDTQGAELAVLRGAPRLLRTCRRWVIEYWPEGLTAAGAESSALYDVLADAGFTVQSPDRVVLSRASIQDWIQSGQIFMNVVAVR